MVVGVRVGEGDDRGQASEVFGEHHDAREFLERDVIEAVVRVKQGPVLGDHRQVLIQQVEHLLPVEADVFWASLLVVADHDGLLGQG